MRSYLQRSKNYDGFKNKLRNNKKVVYEISLRGGVKKGIFYGQADCKLLSPTPPYGQLIVIFFCVLLTLHYDYMCSEMDFTRGHFHFSILNSSLLFAAALSKNGPIAI